MTSDRTVPEGTAVVLFDGVCNLCHRAVRFLLRRDRHQRFCFASLQSRAARDLLAAAGAGQLPDSVVLVEGDRVSSRSTAVLRIARRLGLPWSLCCAFLVVPRPLRDWVYDRVARRRYRWFGRRATCPAPPTELRPRFLDAGEHDDPGAGV